MICVGCGDKIIGEPYWVENQPFCCEECAAVDSEEEFDEELDNEEFEFDEFDEEYEY